MRTLSVDLNGHGHTLWKFVRLSWLSNYHGLALFFLKNWRQIRQRSDYAGEIWKRSFISTVRPTVHTNPARRRNFSKTLFKPGKSWKRRLCVFVWTENILKTELSVNDDVTVIMWFSWPSFSRTQIHLMHFQSETSVFKFLRLSVDEA